MLVDQAFADAVAADFREVLQNPARGNGLIHREKMQRPRDRMMKRSEPLECNISGKLLISLREILPCFHDFRSMSAPLRTRQHRQELVFRLRKRLERELARCLVHESRVISEIPALHRRIDAELVHDLILLVKIARNRDKRH